MSRGSCPGYSLVELLVVAAIVATVAGVSLPVLTHVSDVAEAAAASRHLAGAIARARFEAARRHRTVALRFADDSSDAPFSLFVDGDGDGVAAADVAAGIDPPLSPPDRLSDHFGAARFAVAGAMPGIDSSGPLTSLDAPIRLGPGQQVSVTPLGTSTSGTLYIASRRGVQYAVRIAGVTGRVRVLRYVPGEMRWLAQ
jgi:prepilin-type N-terminal cleavage/methylation domain-containing protein